MTTRPIPNRLYHATWPSRVESIQKEGLRQSREGVYLCSRPEHAAGFVNLRGGEVVGIKEFVYDGKTHKVPDLVIHGHIVVFEVATALLDPLKFGQSDDHNALFFPEGLESWVYADSIGFEHLVGLHRMEVVR